MIFDLTELFSNAQAITATTASTNVFDSGNPGTTLNGTNPLTRDLGKGNTLPLAIRVVQSFNNLTNLQIAYQVADDAAFTQNLTTVAQSPAYTLAQVQTGNISGSTYLLPDSVPIGANRRYHRLMYTVTGTAPTTGQITAGFTAGNQTNTNL